jgi:hypothetical protein
MACVNNYILNTQKILAKPHNLCSHGQVTSLGMFVLFIIRKLSKDIVRIVKWYPHPIREDLRIVNSILIRKFADTDTRYPRILRMLPQPKFTLVGKVHGGSAQEDVAASYGGR